MKLVQFFSGIIAIYKHDLILFNKARIITIHRH